MKQQPPPSPVKQRQAVGTRSVLNPTRLEMVDNSLGALAFVTSGGHQESLIWLLAGR